MVETLTYNHISSYFDTNRYELGIFSVIVNIKHVYRIITGDRIAYLGLRKDLSEGYLDDSFDDGRDRAVVNKYTVLIVDDVFSL